MKIVRVTEMFNSISGEVSLAAPQGTPTSFIRLQGCNLSCDYCDAKNTHSYSVQNLYRIYSVIDWIKEQPCKHVLITGGEPLLQQEAVNEILWEIVSYSTNSKTVTIETNGTIFPFDKLLCNVDCWVVDYKLSDVDKMMNLDQLRSMPRSVVKFVISGYNQAIDAFKIISELKKIRGPVQKYAISLIQPNNSNFTEKQLFDLIMEYSPNTIINTQIHKILNFF